MKYYIAVDSDNNWLHFGEFDDVSQCFEEARHADKYDGGTIFIYEVTDNKPVFEGQ